MTAREQITACPQCDDRGPHLTHTELVHGCGGCTEARIVEWTECGRCHRWLACHLWPVSVPRNG
jgi:hypothetical protein